MSFVRTGDISPAQILKFRCVQCGREAIALTNGKCIICNSQKSILLPIDPAMFEEELKDVHKKS